MVSNPILTRFELLSRLWQPEQRNLHSAFLNPERLPRFVQDCPATIRILNLLGPLPWHLFPERNLNRFWGQTAIPHTAFSVACLIKLNENLVSMGDLRSYRIEHPAFIWLLGLPLVPSTKHACGFDPSASLPTQRHLTQMLRDLPNSSLQFILEQSISLLVTKHIIAWVKENNPKAYVRERFNKAQQPKGDPDCKLGCKRKHNRRLASPSPDTPTKNAVPAHTVAVEYFWGYGSGIIVVKVPGWGEFVLAELTQTFDKPDVSYFFPLVQTA